MAHFRSEDSTARVYLNNKFIQTAMEADEEEGWVDIWDIHSLAPLKDDNFTEEEPAPLEEVPVKRLFGKVEIRGESGR